jgi:hypothetical protein
MTIDVHVRVEGGNGAYLGPPVSMVVSGEGSQNFLGAIKARIKAEQGSEVLRDYGLYGIRWTDPDYPAFLMQDGTELTFAQVRDFFGTEIDADPPTITVDDGGYGGDEGLWFEFSIEIIKGAMEVAGVVGAALGAQRQLARLRFADYRRLAKDWNDGGVISSELRDFVYNHGNWDRTDFDRAFNLGDSRGPQLLRDLGYERRQDEWGNESWWRDADRYDDY